MKDKQKVGEGSSREKITLLLLSIFVMRLKRIFFYLSNIQFYLKTKLHFDQNKNQTLPKKLSLDLKH